LFGKDNHKYVTEAVKAVGMTKASVPVEKFTLHAFLVCTTRMWCITHTTPQRIEEELTKRQDLDEVFVPLGKKAAQVKAVMYAVSRLTCLQGQIDVAEFQSFLVKVRLSTWPA
jgi:hypothetical protein